MKTCLSGKVTIEELPVGGADAEERRLVSAKGEMAQILNRPDFCVRHLVYWDLDSAKSGQCRGNHYHLKKTERYYVIAGRLELFLFDMATSLSETIRVSGGARITVPPRVAHVFRSLSYSQVLEFASEIYDSGDTKPFDATGWKVLCK